MVGVVLLDVAFGVLVVAGFALDCGFGVTVGTGVGLCAGAFDGAGLGAFDGAGPGAWDGAGPGAWDTFGGLESELPFPPELPLPELLPEVFFRGLSILEASETDCMTGSAAGL